MLSPLVRMIVLEFKVSLKDSTSFDRFDEILNQRSYLMMISCYSCFLSVYWISRKHFPLQGRLWLCPRVYPVAKEEIFVWKLLGFPTARNSGHTECNCLQSFLRTGWNCFSGTMGQRILVSMLNSSSRTNSSQQGSAVHFLRSQHSSSLASGAEFNLISSKKSLACLAMPVMLDAFHRSHPRLRRYMRRELNT